MTSSKDFLWGVATSGYQSEGGYNQPGQPQNNWSVWEKQGKVMPTKAAAEFWTRYEEDFQNCQNLGINSFRLGLEWARIQPSTSVEAMSAPAFDTEALDAYADRIAACRRHGLEPIVTLHHFTHPAWLGVDAWLSKDTIDCFAEYVRVAVTHINRRLCDRYQLPPIHWYITINEPNILVSNTYLSGMFPGGSERGITTMFQAYNHLLTAHVRAYKYIHHLYQTEGWATPQVSLNTYCSDLYWSEKVIWDLLEVRKKGIKPSELREWTYSNAQELETALRNANLPFRRNNLPYQLGRLSHWLANRLGTRNFDIKYLDIYLQELENAPHPNVFDYVAIDYYDPFIAHTFRLPNFTDFEFETKDFRGWLMSGITSKWWDWRTLPEGLHFFCQFYAQKLGYPIMIAENGMALRRKPDNSNATRRPDQFTRSEFIKAHLQQVKRLQDEGVPMLGYMHWSLTDNYEWGSYTPRFGLFAIDFAAGTERLVEDHLGDRPSQTYAKLIREASLGG